MGVGSAADDLLHEVLLVGVGLHAHHRHHDGSRRILHLLGLPGVHPRPVRIRESLHGESPRTPGPGVEPRDSRRRNSIHCRQLLGRQTEVGRPSQRRRVSSVGQPAGGDPSEVHGRGWRQEEQPPACIRLLGHIASLPLPTRVDARLPLDRARDVHARHAVFVPHIPHDASRSSYIPRRRKVQREIPRILAGVLRQGTIQDHPRYFLTLTTS